MRDDNGKIGPDILEDLFSAYEDARRNKRSTLNALAFEMEYEKNLLGLCAEIVSGTYRLRPSVCFIASHPITREVFAADFRDRVVHHLVYNYINPYFERLFIPDSYSCRPGRGTSYGIRRVDHFIRSCSHNYRKDCFILKLDIRGYFMAIDRAILYRKVENALERFRERIRFDYELVNAPAAPDHLQ